VLIAAVISILEDFGSLLPARTVTVKNGFILSEILIFTVTYFSFYLSPSHVLCRDAVQIHSFSRLKKRMRLVSK